MEEDKQPAIFFAGDKEKAEATEICSEIIDIIEKGTDDVMFKCYIMQMLLESFEENFNVDIRNGMSFSSNVQITKGDKNEI